MLGRKQFFINAQRGVSLSGLVVVLAVAGLVAVLALKVSPSFIEYRAIKAAIVKAKADGGSVAEMQNSFDKAADINSISSIHGKDLDISKGSGEPEISFAYEKRIGLFGNVSLVIDYEGTTDKSGVVAAETAASAAR
jgi:hypothetical protein